MFEKNIEKYIQKYRKNIPKEFNQCKLLDYLTDENTDMFISISNRADGKTFGYNKFFINLSIDFGIKFLIITRHFTLRNSFEEDLIRIMDKTNEIEKKKIYDINDVIYKREQFYTLVMYKNKIIGMITDLNAATDLKRFSALTQDFPIIIYDEFLALDDDYLPDEYEKLKIIYQNVDRKKEKLQYIYHPKIFLLGNAVNLNSPILAKINIFNLLDRHKMNTVRKYNRIVLEIHKNEFADRCRNTKIFDELEDTVAKSTFNFNMYNIAHEKDIDYMKKNSEKFNIKYDNNIISVEFNEEGYIILSSSIDNNILFVNNLKDKTANNIYLNEDFYDPDYYRYHEKGKFLYGNSYTKILFSNNQQLLSLKINKCILKYKQIKQSKKNSIIKDDKIDYDKYYIERTKKSLLKKLHY